MVNQDASWSVTDHLLAAVVDVLQAANWQRAGDSKAPRPKPIPRPGDVKADDARADLIRRRALAFRERPNREGPA